MIAKNKQLEKVAKLKLNKNCFKYRKKDYYIKDCYLSSNKKKSEELLEEGKYTQ